MEHWSRTEEGGRDSEEVRAAVQQEMPAERSKRQGRQWENTHRRGQG